MTLRQKPQSCQMRAVSQELRKSKAELPWFLSAYHVVGLRLAGLFACPFLGDLQNRFIQCSPLPGTE
jgi:hypothetical protein